MKPILSVIKDEISGKFKGAVYVNTPTPGGWDRWLLQLTTTKEYSDSKIIAKIMNERFPDYVQIEIEE